MPSAPLGVQSANVSAIMSRSPPPPPSTSFKESLFSVIRVSRASAAAAAAAAAAAENSNSHNRSANNTVSPSRITRQQEKDDMQNLNDRLVVYIDTVRRLEVENGHLRNTVQSYTEKSTQEVAEIKGMYEQELDDAKRLIDELAKEKAKCEIALNKATSDMDDALGKYGKLVGELKTSQAKLKAAESESLEYKSRYESSQADNTRKADELDKLRPLVDDLGKQVARLRKQLEDETLQRVDLENKNQTLKENLTFKTQIYHKEVEQMRASKRVELEQVDHKLRDEYDSRLVAELQRIRDETDHKIVDMKTELERRHHAKLVDAKQSARRAQASAASLREDLAAAMCRCDELAAELKAQQAKVAQHDAKLNEAEERLRRASAKHDLHMQEKDAELLAMRNETQELLVEYQELYDIKINLDMEISAYRKLLECEEQRLNISTATTTTTTTTGASASAQTSAAATAAANQLGSSFLCESNATGQASRGKRRRMANAPEQDDQVVSSSSQHVLQSASSDAANLQIDEHDLEGKCVRVSNKSDKEVALAGWTLKRLADGKECEYKFAKAVVLAPGRSLTVWSSAAGVIQDLLAGDLVMGAGHKWLTGDSMTTLLHDKDSIVRWSTLLF